MGQLIRCWIVNTEAGGDRLGTDNSNPSKVEAWYNPKEIGIDKAVTWSPHPRDKVGGKDPTDADTSGDTPWLEFTSSTGKTLSVELLFDTYESGADVYKEYVSKLERFTAVINQDTKKRPPLCAFVWGSKFPVFQGVINSLNVKYTMFLEDGTPCRATVTVKMMQADKVTSKGEKADRATQAAIAQGGR